MGQRSPAETIIAILQAFLRNRTWKQNELAEEIGIKRHALKQHLDALSAKGMPLHREEEHPHVYWSVPRDWFPGGVLYPGDVVRTLLRVLSRLPKTKDRDRLLAIAAECLAEPKELPRRFEQIIAAKRVSVSEENYLATIEESAEASTALYCRYISGGGKDSWRHLSVQKIFPGAPARFIAWCHRDERLKWFRADNVVHAELDAKQPFKTAKAAEIERVEAESVDGYFEQGPARAISFLVRDPEARWVAKNLLEGMTHEVLARGIRVRARTAAISSVARFVVGLGGAATPEDPTLAAAVEELARGALEAARTLKKAG